MRRLMVVSPLDVLGSPNSRTHHLVRHLSSHFQETIAISRTNITYKSFWYKLTALFRIRTVVSIEGNIKWVAMTHWGSVRQGLGLSLLGLTNPYFVPKWGIRRILRRVFSFLGIVFELGVLPSLLFTFIAKVRRTVDVSIGEGPWEVALALLLRAFGLTGVVVYDDIDYAPGFQPISGLRKSLIAALERFTIRHANLVVSVSDRLAHLRREQGAQNVYVIPNGVDWDKFASAGFMRNKKYREPSTLIYMGYLGAWAGIDLILEAVALVYQRFPKIRMILLGHGAPEELNYLREKIVTLGMRDVVNLRGEVSYEELPKHLSEADIALAMFQPLDLTRYAFPLKVVEYRAAGLPVITTEGTEAADFVSKSGGGVAVPFDATAVADAIQNMLLNLERYHPYSKEAETLSPSYDWGRLFGYYYSLIREPDESQVKIKESD